MSTPRDRVIEVLAKHRPSGTVDSATGTYGCTCGADVPVPGGWDSYADPLDYEAYQRSAEGHRADVLAAADLVPETEEWGTEHHHDLDMADPWVNTWPDEATARANARQHGRDLPVLHRFVTPWTTVEDTHA